MSASSCGSDQEFAEVGACEAAQRDHRAVIMAEVERVIEAGPRRIQGEACRAHHDEMTVALRPLFVAFTGLCTKIGLPDDAARKRKEAPALPMTTMINSSPDR